MTEKVIIFKNLNGSCGVIIPSLNMFNCESKDRINLKNLGTEFENNQEILEWNAKKVPIGLKWRITDISNIPSNRTFRDAWTDDNNTETVDIDISKAKEIHKNNLRILRKPILEQLDKDYLIADENHDNEKKSVITKTKQQLRDITSLELPNDPEQLKNFIPDVMR